MPARTGSGAMHTKPDSIEIGPGDALVAVDVQQDFLAGGAHPVPGGAEIVAVLNGYVRLFAAARLPIYATRDWHPPRHCSFRPGGPWPVHCVAGTAGAAFPRELLLPPATVIVSKAQEPERDAYSAFSGTLLARQLWAGGTRRLFVGGLATDQCVLHTVEDALALGFRAVLLTDAVRAMNLRPGDGAAAVAHIQGLGARTATLDRLQPRGG